ncbi:hypothetical protein HDU90_008597 [Geranomyces variabilis]|nr:hypothetical protein HDU90_008597 [Geranomyces variabilis]
MASQTLTIECHTLHKPHVVVTDPAYNRVIYTGLTHTRKPNLTVTDATGEQIATAHFNDWGWHHKTDVTLRDKSFVMKPGGPLRDKDDSFVASSGQKLTWKIHKGALQCVTDDGAVVAAVSKIGKGPQTIELPGPVGEDVLFSAVVATVLQRRRAVSGLAELGGNVAGMAGSAAGGGGPF